jgi:hypothetical protein
MEDTIGRQALYYPYIHIRSEHWLKATLLCTPAVKRIVPDSYTPEDLPRILKYTEIVGPNGPLLQSVPSASAAAYDAQNRLLAKIREHEPQILEKYQRSHVSPADVYRIHVAKFNEVLLHYLLEHGLAWHTDHPDAYGHRSWYALHPVLGSAIMTTLGLSIAREQHYDVVTPSTEFHEALLTTRESDIFDTLLSRDEPKPVPTIAQVGHDLGQLVITLTGINFESLHPERIPELQSSKHFRQFQRLIRTNAHFIDREADPEGYRERVLSEANEIIDAWHETKGDLSKDLRDALFESALIFSAEALKAHGGAADAGAAATGLVAAGGVAIGLLVIKGLRLGEKRRRGSPYQYLTQVMEAESEVLRLTFPLGLES